MNLVAPHLNVAESVATMGQLNDEEPPSRDTAQLNHFDPSILKTTLKNSKTKKNLQSKTT